MTLATIEKCNVSQNLDLTKTLNLTKPWISQKNVETHKRICFSLRCCSYSPPPLLHSCNQQHNQRLTDFQHCLSFTYLCHSHKVWVSCFWAGLGKQTFSSLLKFSFFQILIQENVRFKPPNQRQGAFLRVWAGGGEATLATTSLGGKVTAKLELELGQPFYKHFLWSWSCSPVTILAIEGLLLRLSLEHQPNSLILKRLQLLLHQKKLILQPQLIMLQIYTRNTYAY